MTEDADYTTRIVSDGNLISYEIRYTISPSTWEYLEHFTEGTSISTTGTYANTSSTSSTDIAWYIWTAGEWQICPTEDISQTLSPAQEEAFRIQLEEQTREREELMLAEDEAQHKADILLNEFLTRRQRKSLKELGHFEVITPRGKTYRIRRGRSNNVREINEDGNEIAMLCAHPTEYVPDADTMLAQKLMLETAEEEFLRIANRSPIHGDPIHVN